MHAFQAFRHEGGGDGAGGEAFAAEGFVGERELIDLGGVRDRMDAGDFADAMGGDLRLHAEAFLEQLAEALGRAGRGVQLVDVVRLLHGGRVAVALEHLAHALHGGEQGVHAEGEVRRIDERRAGLLEGLEHVGLDVVPARRPHHRGLEVLRDEGIIGPERIRPGEIDDDAFLRHRRVHAADVLACRDEFDSPPGQFLFDHMAHPAVSADDYLHNNWGLTSDIRLS